MTGNEFLKTIEEATGKKLSTDYGFVIGTHSPYSDTWALSSSHVKGYGIWKKDKDGKVEHTHVKEVTDEKANLDFIINFLNT